MNVILQGLLIFVAIWYGLDVLDWVRSFFKRWTAKNELERKQAEDLMADLRSLKNGPRG